MKKHPVDDLFARKLGEWEPKPSSAAWERIQATQKKKERRLGGWYWYAAAGVVVVLLAGYAVWQAQPEPSGREMAGTQVPQTVSPAQVPSRPESPEERSEVPTYSELSAEPGVRYKIQEQVAKVEPKPKVAPPAVVEATSPEPAMEKAPVEADPQAALALTESTTVRPDGTPTERQESTSVYPPKPAAEPAPSRTIIARVEVPDSEDESQKSSRFAKVLRQLKNIKEGEEVDWKEMGINPKKMIARADARLKSEEEKVSKQYQNLKEKL